MEKKTPAELLATLTKSMPAPANRITGPDQIERPAPRADRPDHYKLYDQHGQHKLDVRSAADAQNGLEEVGWTIRTPEGRQLAERLEDRIEHREYIGGTRSLRQDLLTAEFEHDLRAEGVEPTHKAEQTQQQEQDQTPKALRDVLAYLPADQHDQARKDFAGLTTGEGARTHDDALKIMAEQTPAFRTAKHAADAQHEQDNTPITVQGAEHKSVLQDKADPFAALRAAGPKPPLAAPEDGKTQRAFADLRAALAQLNDVKTQVKDVALNEPNQAPSQHRGLSY